MDLPKRIINHYNKIYTRSSRLTRDEPESIVYMIILKWRLKLL